MFAVGVDVSNGRSTVAVLGARRKVVMKPFEVPHSADGFASLAPLYVFHRVAVDGHENRKQDTERRDDSFLHPGLLFLLLSHPREQTLTSILI